jgi:hypothetical protein
MRQLHLASQLAFILLGTSGSSALAQGLLEADAAVAPQASAQPTSGATDLASNEPAALPSFAFALRAGLVAFGSGLDRLECTGEGCNGLANGERSYGFKPSPLVTVGAYYQPLAVLRTGPVLGYAFQQSVEFEASSGRTDLGDILTVGWALELTPQVAKQLWIVPQLQVAYALLFPRGDLERGFERWETSCEQSFAEFEDCGSLGGNRAGIHASAGVGLLYAASPAVRLRLDLLTEYYFYPLLELSAADGDAKLTERTSGVRQLCLAGLEF